MRQIAKNAGLEGLVIVEKIRNRKPGMGFDALKETYVDMVKSGIVDSAKVTRSTLQNAASTASTFLTTKAVVTDIPEKNPAPMPGASGRIEMDGMY